MYVYRLNCTPPHRLSPKQIFSRSRTWIESKIYPYTHIHLLFARITLTYAFTSCCFLTLSFSFLLCICNTIESSCCFFLVLSSTSPMRSANFLYTHIHRFIFILVKCDTYTHSPHSISSYWNTICLRSYHLRHAALYDYLWNKKSESIEWRIEREREKVRVRLKQR